MALELRRVATVRVARGPIVLAPLVLTARSIVTGDTGEFVVRFDKHTHTELWRKRKPVSLRSAHGDRILIYDETTDTTQLWNEQGSVVWKHTGDAEALRDRLFFNLDGRLEVIEASTGRTIDEFACPPGPACFFHDGVLLLCKPDLTTDLIQAIDMAGRTAVWRDDLKSKIEQQYGDPCPSGLAFVASLPGQAVIKTGAHLVAVSLADGSLGWGLPISVPHVAPRARNGRLYVWSSAHGEIGADRVVIADEATGAILVDRPLADYGPAFRRDQPVYGGTLCQNHVVFTSTTGLVAVFRLGDGELAWHHQYPTHFRSPVVENNRVYITTADGDIEVFEAEGETL